MFEAGTFQEQPDFWDAGFVVKITAASQVGQRWYYAFTEQVPQPQISNAADATAQALYEDHPNARTGVVPGDGIGPYLTEINNRQLSVGDLVRVRHKTETPAGTVFEAEAGGGSGGGTKSPPVQSISGIPASDFTVTGTLTQVPALTVTLSQTGNYLILAQVIGYISGTGAAGSGS